MFETKLKSFLALLPIKFWIIHVNETNRYMEQEYQKKLTENKGQSKITKPRVITINELMIFYAILFQMAMKPIAGYRYTKCWTSKFKEWYSACKYMPRKRFQEIRNALHWCNNNLKSYGNTDENGKQDTLYKIRFFLNTMKELLNISF